MSEVPPGAETLTVAADVSEPDAVHAVAARAVERFGRIDAWVNAASVMMFGSLIGSRPGRHPIFTNAANYSGRRSRALPPVCTPERVARIIVNLIRVPRPEVIAGGFLAHAFFLQHRILPSTAERVLALEVDGGAFPGTTPPEAACGGHRGRRGHARRGGTPRPSTTPVPTIVVTRSAVEVPTRRPARCTKLDR